MRMPGVLRIGLERMMPRLKAEEELALASAVAVGSGVMDRREVRKWLRERQDLMRGRRKVQRASSWEEHFEQLRRRGFNVTISPPPGEEAAAT